jgi:hypothetical protein
VRYGVVGLWGGGSAAGRLSCDRSCGLVLAFTLVYDLLEQKTSYQKDADNGPDFQGRLGRGGRGVGRGVVRAGGFAGLTQAGGAGSGDAERAGGASKREGAKRELGECCRHGRCGEWG